ncbi:MAG: macro domain-containing protein [Candidatus Zixiibacteriota bacterium]
MTNRTSVDQRTDLRGDSDMSDTLQVKNSTLRLMKADITDIEIESFVYYAQHDLALGSGFGTAISMRGGPTVQQELKALGTLETTEAVVTAAGDMKATYIIHAVGPRFQEEDLEEKLRKTIRNALQKAEDRKIKAIAFPAMGAGFYGVPLDVSARITIKTIVSYLNGETGIRDVVICLNDMREYRPFQSQLASSGNG